jgi:3-oxoacyl-[acyl-carrier protein] reductase
MDYGLSGKNVIVTGGSKGIGREVCAIFLAEGANVEMCARNVEEIEATIKELSSLGSIHATSVDVADQAALASWVDAAATRLGGIDCLVCNASAMSMGVEEENWRSNLEVDLMGSQNATTSALPYLVKSAEAGNSPAVIMTSSTSALETPYANSYGAVKAAIIHLSKGLARQYAPAGIRFNSVSPGTIFIEGGAWNMAKDMMPAVYEDAMKRNPTGRMGTAAEVANAVVFLSSPLSSFTTGANLVIDGAITARINY